ncbi:MULTISPECIES: FimV/HubP family polar landmark protein [unclassified Halomonas]|uniref:FimV/HubP family polar landmark protein n=1 Tax=unclassified Halomonas TaxID=2609666 RepID=UPI002884BBB9|nr:MULTISPECIES: FimV/HubP family polar landmark protein [unclassified Halomonas]MDT0499448.1 FimV/HubP family polar landmark protein [Halomonas sp. PAR7]MDT0510735.1 FimV/HubP family polar landmark protein [Halomonas sp. LES1]
MKRKLTLAMLLSLSATSPMALALGLGEVVVRSTLNTPLRASVPLVDAAGIQPGLLNVSVAGERAYDAAGLARTSLAASVGLSVERRQGRLYVDFTTERPVREPWLDLLLELEWPSGQMVREVTMLLDPPNYAEMPALVTGSSRSVAASTPTPGDRRPESSTPSSGVARSAASTSREPAWVRSGDTLWGVAGRLRPDSGISMKQMMVALVAANPEAFPSGNINAMRAGVTLSVPGRAAIVSRSPAEAERVVSAMNQAWANRGRGAPARVPLDATRGVAERAVAATQEAPRQTEVSSVEGGESAANADVSATDAPATDVAQAEPTAAEESASVDESAEPRLTLLTDAQVAAEQGASETDDTAVSTENGGDGAAENPAPALAEADASSPFDIDPELSEALHAEGGLTEDQRLVRLEERWRQSQAQLEAVQAERNALEDELGDMRDELATLRDQLAALTADGTGVQGPGAVGGLDAASVNEQEMPWWGGFYPGEWDRNLVLGGAGLAALLALWLVLRRRRAGGEGRSSEAGVIRVATPGAASPTQATSPTIAAANESTMSANLLQAEAVNEADIYIAYGRYDQARELLEDNLEREPERDDLRFKLLGVYLELGSYQAAERQAEKLMVVGTPAMAEEAERLMAQYGLAAASRGEVPAGEDRGEPADFGEAAALPPRLFDQPPGDGAAETETPPLATDNESPPPVSESLPDERPESTGSPRPAGAGMASPVGEEAPSEPAAEPEKGPGPESERQSGAERAPGAGRGQETEPESVSKPVAAEPEESSSSLGVTSRRLDNDHEMLDYRPPALDSPAPSREETPMQPSVEFTTEGLGVAEKDAGFERGENLGRGDVGTPADRAFADNWEVEEVSFPPLQTDNSQFSISAAQRLLDTGEAGRARELLDELSRNGDPATRADALALLRRLDA